MAKKLKKLDKKHIAFIENYLMTFNATQAYQMAYGVQDKDIAKAGGYRLRHDPLVQMEINNRLESMEKPPIEELIWFYHGIATGSVTGNLQNRMYAIDRLMNYYTDKEKENKLDLDINVNLIDNNNCDDGE